MSMVSAGLLSVLLLICSPVGGKVTPSVKKEDVKVVDYKGLEAYLGQFEDETLVINFWATWCVPCVKELPYFEQLTASNATDVEVILVSLDFSSQINSKLKPFLHNNQLKSRVVVLDDPDQTTWINKIDPDWSGAIPMTLIRKGDKKIFHEGAFTSYEELRTLIQSI